MKASDSSSGQNPTQLISERIASLADWRGELVARLRALIHDVDPDVSEEWKWSTPVWSHAGLLCAAAAFKDHVKLNFFNGASLPDPTGLFNAGLEAKATRAIDFHEGDSVDESALGELIRAAVAHNIS